MWDVECDEKAGQLHRMSARNQTDQKTNKREDSIFQFHFSLSCGCVQPLHTWIDYVWNDYYCYSVILNFIWNSIHFCPALLRSCAIHRTTELRIVNENKTSEWRTRERKTLLTENGNCVKGQISELEVRAVRVAFAHRPCVHNTSICLVPSLQYPLPSLHVVCINFNEKSCFA